MQHPKIRYHSNEDIPKDHWCLKKLNNSDQHFIADIVVESDNSTHSFNVKLNPTDSRGYRSIITLTSKNMRSTINREYTEDEHSSLHTAMRMVASIYRKLGLIVQEEIAGNNSQEFDLENNEIIIGRNEPSFLHAHIIGRGDIDTHYVKGVPLRGPPLGELFNMREGKTKWKDGEMEKVKTCLQNMSPKQSQ